MPDMKRHITLRDNTGKRIRVVLDNWRAAHDRFYRRWSREYDTLCSAGSLAPENCADPSSACAMAASGTKIPSNAPILVTLPVADVSACNGDCSVPVTGFAQVFLYDLQKLSGSICGPGVGSYYDISGCFVQQTDPNGGGGVAGAPNLGAIDSRPLFDNRRGSYGDHHWVKT
jgi:hypothetical protein